MKLNRKWILLAALVLSVAMATTGTLAYLTDEDADVNTMTLGSVKIEQHEYERVQNADGTYEMVTSEKYGEGYKLQEFTQAKPLMPATGEITGWGKKVPFDQLSSKAAGAQAVFAGLKNVQDKFVLVENTGKSDAYVRSYIALEYGSNTKDIIGISTGDFWDWNGLGVIEISGNNYYVYEVIYKGSDSRHVGGILPAGEYTYSSLNQIYLMNEATNEDMEALDGNGNGTYDILVLSQAIQVAGFEEVGAAGALNEGFGEGTAENVQEWFEGIAPKGPEGKVTIGYTRDTAIWGEGGGNAKKSLVIKVFSGDTYMGETSLNNIDGIIDGDVYVTWNLKLNPTNNDDSYWTMSWEKVPTVDLQPTKVEMWIDGKKVAENVVQLNGPDNLNKITGAVVDTNGTILRYVVSGTTPTLAEGESLVTLSK